MQSPTFVGAPMVTTDNCPGARQGPLAVVNVATRVESRQADCTRCSPVPPLQYDAATTTAAPATQPVGSADAGGAVSVVKAAPAAHTPPASRTRAIRFEIGMGLMLENGAPEIRYLEQYWSVRGNGLPECVAVLRTSVDAPTPPSSVRGMVAQQRAR
ncbi:hypothetical protein GTC6_18803 [Gordonia terrae C-6]|uniref:Uncharacterized protein n=1 Tax=Gordonia terrae C-6 TaxID=1316928 RepID=R7Y5C0_9ACTN|nr:hypothetical protein GTC6_18803 [Gordonia terrae C-6]